MPTDTATEAPAATPRQRRREALTEEILDAAWELCREHGLSSLSLRELASRVGMRAPSLYSYFDSKDAIYDAMFRQGQQQLGERMQPYDEATFVDRTVVKEAMRTWFRFCTEDPVRYQLLFQRTLPGFEPSEQSYALAVEQLDLAGRRLAQAGVTEPAHLDMWTAVFTGLTSQQISNDPGGDRWERLVDETVDMILDHCGVPTGGGEAS